MKRVAALLFSSLFLMAAAPDPADMLANKAQEGRARTMFKQIRCVVCQNESIDDSAASMARDLRQTVRSQIQAGKSDDQVRAFLVDKYGDFILLKPIFNIGNALLWLGPFVIVLAGVALIVARRKPVSAETELTVDEANRLTQLQNNSRSGSNF